MDDGVWGSLPPARRTPIEPALTSHCPGLPEASGVK